MNVTMIERNCADCALWVEWYGCLPEKGEGIRENPEEAAERQIRQIERNFGPDWKW